MPEAILNMHGPKGEGQDARNKVYTKITRSSACAKAKQHRSVYHEGELLVWESGGSALACSTLQQQQRQ